MITRSTPSRRRRGRRRWPWVLLAIVAVAAFALWRVAGDSGRLSALLIEQARSRFALEITLGQPARFDFFPVLSLRLDGVTATATGSMQTLFTADALTARVPWRALWQGRASIDGLDVARPTLYAKPLADWFAIVGAASDGPPSALRWPQVDETVRVTDLTVVDADGAVMLGPLDIASTTLHTDALWQPRFAWRSATHRFDAAPRAVVRDTPTGLALDQFAVDVIGTPLAAPATPTTLSLSGRIAFDSAATWSVDLHVDAATWPTWLPALPAVTATADAARATSLTLRIVSGGASAMALVADGTLDGTAISASLVGDALPDFSRPLPALVDDLARHWRGRATVPALSVGGVAIEGLTIEATPDDAATADAATTGAAPVTAKPATTPPPR